MEFFNETQRFHQAMARALEKMARWLDMKGTIVTIGIFPLSFSGSFSTGLQAKWAPVGPAGTLRSADAQGGQCRPWTREHPGLSCLGRSNIA